MTKKIPEIRFAGFSGDWKENKIRDVGKLYSGGTPKSTESRYYNGDIPFIRSGEIYSSETKLFINEEAIEESSAKYVKKGDILFAMYGANSGEVKRSKINGAINQAILAIIPDDNFHNIFIEMFLAKNKDKINSKYLQGGQKNLSAAIVKSIKFSHGTFEEQEKIGELFETLDACLEDQASYVETLKKSKKAFLQKLFPKKGATVPELRFPGFEGNWEEIELGNISSITTGKLDANAMVENGKYDFYTSGIAKYKIDTFAFEGPSITIAGNGATVGYMHLADGKFNAYQRTYVISDFKGDRHFIYYSIKTKLPKKIHEESRAGNIPYIVLDMLTNLKILLPTLAEQEQIGTFFKDLDEKIEKEEDKLSSFERLKKALLQKVFV